MAFMAMKKNLDERARKKAFDEIFEKFDRNKNGCVKKVLKICCVCDLLKVQCMQKTLCERLTIR